MKVAPVEIIVQDLSLQPTTSKLTRRLSFRSIRGESMLPTRKLIFVQLDFETDHSFVASRSRVTSINSAYIQPVNGSDPSLNSMKSVVSTSESSPRAKKILVKLWLMSAASFRRGGRLEESKAAIAEAEKANADDEEVWAQVRISLNTVQI